MTMRAFFKSVLSRLNVQNASGYQLYGAVVSRARQPAFYEAFGVADTVDGRFDMIVLHIFLLSRRLSGSGREKELAQQVINHFFADMDRSLREMGAGDLSVPKKIKKMAAAFNGRMSAYHAAFDDGTREAMTAAIARNVYPDAEVAPAAAARLAAYAFAAHDALAAQSFAQIAGGEAAFPDPATAEPA